MSYLCSFMEIVNAFCQDEAQVEELLQKNHLLQRENSVLETEDEEYESEQVRLQIELFNVDTKMKSPNQRPKEKSFEATNLRLMEACNNIRYAISQIDFMKILQCNHIQMEQNYRCEWQQFQESTVSMLKWHEKMEQRDIVQRYRKVELVYKEVEQNIQKNRQHMEKTLQQSEAKWNKAHKERDTLILQLAEFYVNMKKMDLLKEYQEKYAPLYQRKLEMLEKLQAGKTENFTSMMPYKTRFYDRPSTHSSSQSKDLDSHFNYDMPKFPSFNDILKSCNQDLPQMPLKPQITMIENTTNIMVKSILRNSQDNSMEINQSITTKHTKHVHFKMQLEERFEFKETTTDSTVSDSSSDELMENKNELTPSSTLINETETDITTEDDAVPVVDLLTPSGNEEPKSTETQQITNQERPKPKIDILECVIIKPATTTHNTTASESPVEDKENIAPKSASNHKRPVNPLKLKKRDNVIMPPPQTPTPSQMKRDILKKSFYDEYLSDSPSVEIHMDTESGAGTTSRTMLKDFDSYINAHGELGDFTQSEGNIGNTVLLENNEVTGDTDADNDLDFSINEFMFDSNDENDGDMFGGEGGVMDFLS